MSNDSIKYRSWINKHWKWFVPMSGMLIIIAIFFISGMNKVTADIAKAYTDNALYKNAIEKANSDVEVIEFIGNIEFIDKMAILEGQVQYSNDNKTVSSTVRVVGEKHKGKMDIVANRNNNIWIYTKINIRVKNSTGQSQIVEVKL